MSLRRCFHSLQVCVEGSMNVVVMLMRDMGLVVEDDCTKMEKITREMVMDKSECGTLKDYNGLKNAIVHRYNHLDMKYVEGGWQE